MSTGVLNANHPAFAEDWPRVSRSPIYAQAQHSLTHPGQKALRRRYQPLHKFQHMPILRPPFRRRLRPRPRFFPHQRCADLPSCGHVPLRLHLRAHHLRSHERIIRPQTLLSLLFWSLYSLHPRLCPRAELAGAVGLSAAQRHRGIGATVHPWRGVRRSISEFSAPRQGSDDVGTDQ